MSDPVIQNCPQCGAALPANAPGGLCPHCVMALNLNTETVFTDDTPAVQPPLAPDQIAPHFPQLEILECLGRGGMGVVYKARQISLNRFAALKLLAPERVHDAKFAERFAREARALAALNHPNIVTIYDFGRAGGFYYLLMEFVDGVNLRRLLRTQKCTPEEALAIVPPLCDALQFAHDRGIVHRDIKPENLLLDKSGRVKVADFGIAKMMGAGQGDPVGGAADENVTRSAVGTPGYSAPEQQTDPQRVDSRADIYSLGVVFYEMLTGELPGKQLQPPSRKVRIDVRLDEVVLRALETQPELRYQQASEVKTRVETIAATPDAGGSRREKFQNQATVGDEHKSQNSVPSSPTKETSGPSAGRLADKSPLVRMVEAAFNLTFTSPLAVKFINLSALGFLCFLGYLPLPGWQRCFGFSGFFGLIGAAFPVEFAVRRRQSQNPHSAAPSPTPETPAASMDNRRPRALIVVSLLFIFVGCLSIWDLIRNCLNFTPRFSLTIFFLPLGIGLLRLRWLYRRYALACVWLGLALLLIVIWFMFARANDAAYTSRWFLTGVFGWKTGSAGQTAWLEMIFLAGQGALLFWMHRVLMRPGIKALFEAQRGKRTDWLEALVVILLVVVVSFSMSLSRQALNSASSNELEFRQLDNGPFVAHINQGSVELVAVGNQPWTNRVCWQPNGTPSRQPFPDYNGGMDSSMVDRKIEKIAFRIHNESSFGLSVPVCRFNAESGVTQGGGAAYQPPDVRSPEAGFWQLLACPTNATTMNVSLGVANGPWKTAITLDHSNNGGGSSENSSPQEGEWSATFNSATGPGNTVAVNCNYTQNPDWETRMVGVAAEGKITEIPKTSNSAKTLQWGGLLVMSASDFAQIRSFQLQRRKYQWVEFRNVSLQPGQVTPVMVKDADVVAVPAPVGPTKPPRLETAPQTVPTVTEPAFGPVIERTINSATTGSNYVICFKTGELRTPSPGTPGALADIYPWVQRENLDASVGVIPNSLVLNGYDMALVAAPATCWETLSPAQAARRLAAEPGTSFTIMSQGNLSSLPDTCVFRTREGGLGILQVTGQTANPPGLKVRYKFADPIPTASPADAGGTAADWSPNLLPGEKPNFPKILEEAKSLTATGHYAEALQRFLWEHRHAPESDDSYQKIVRLTSALTDWVELGRRYAPAKQALLEIRDADTREIAAGRGYGDLFQTVQAINRELQDDDATWALFKTMVKTDRQLAGQCYYYAEDLLLQKGEYALCLEFLGDPQANFEGIRRSLEMQTSSQQQMEERRKRFPQPAPPVFKGVFRPFDMGQMATNNFVGRVGKLVEVLVGAGDPATAVKIRDEAVAVLDDPRLRSSVSEAEANLKKHPVPVTNSETK